MAVCAESVSAGIGIGNSHLVAMEDKNGCWSHIVRRITKNVEKSSFFNIGVQNPCG